MRKTVEEMKEVEWFADWFDSPYYPILYKNRDFEEAEAFISGLIAEVAPSGNSHFLDLACGRGRHSWYIYKKGYQVTGLDFSPQSIAEAQALGSGEVNFKVHDMRDPFPGTYDYILNLFTSFGYFSSTSENLSVLQNVRNALNPGGAFVLDFLNTGWVLPNLVPAEVKEIAGIRFDIRKEVKDGIILKNIHVKDGPRFFHFQERVQALDLQTLEQLCSQANLQIYSTWGDYDGSAFEEKTSPRLILFCR